MAVITKQKLAYQFWLQIHRSWPRVERAGIGQKIEQTFLALLETTFSSAYLPVQQKSERLAKANSQLDIIKFFIQIAWENKLITIEKYAELSKNLEEIGRMLYSWKRGLESKTPAG